MLLQLIVGYILLSNGLKANLVSAEYVVRSLVTASEQCTDSVTYAFENEDGVEVDCSWLTDNPSEEAVRVATYCLRPDVKFQCTHTCNACDEECADSPTYEFLQLILNVYKKCAWITESPNLIEVKREGYCDTIGLNCPDACGFCPAREVTMSPTLTPSVVPSSSISPKSTKSSKKSKKKSKGEKGMKKR